MTEQEFVVGKATPLQFEVTGTPLGATTIYTLPPGVTDIAAELHKRDAVISQQAARIKELEEKCQTFIKLAEMTQELLKCEEIKNKILEIQIKTKG